MKNCRICGALNNRSAIGCIPEDIFLYPKPKQFDLLLPGQKSKKFHLGRRWPIDKEIKREGL